MTQKPDRAAAHAPGEVLTDDSWKVKLDTLLRRHDPRRDGAPDELEVGRRARERFRELRATVIEPTLREIGEHLKSHGHEYEIWASETRDVGAGKNDEPSIAFAVYPRGYRRTKAGPVQPPSVVFRAGDAPDRLRTQFVMSMPGRPDRSRAGHTYTIDSVAPDLVRREVFELLEIVLAGPPAPTK